jgi:hypothetical protein
MTTLDTLKQIDQLVQQLITEENARGTPPPSPAPTPVKPGLGRVQNWLGEKTVGVYFGTYTSEWRAPQFLQAAQTLKAWGADYGVVKFGIDNEQSLEWYDGTAADIRNAFISQGLGMSPYLYILPSQVQRGIEVGVKLAKLCEGIILDLEDEWAGHDSEIDALVRGIRSQCPDACIIVSGYGDPIYKFGAGQWPFHVVSQADIVDAYQPQWYFGVWDLYKTKGYLGAINWGSEQCASAFGESIVIQPAIQIQGVDPNDFEGCCQYLSRWHASVAIWEYEKCTASIIQACKKGMKGE